MTKKELVEQLNAYADDDEIFVWFEDEYGPWIVDIKKVGDASQDTCDSHFEVLQDGKWVKWDETKGHPGRMPNSYKPGQFKQVIDRTWTRTEHCIITPRWSE